MLSELNKIIFSMSSNELTIFTTIIAGLFTILVAMIGINQAFKQIKAQFEHKVIYEGWRSLQESLFDLSKALSFYSMKLNSLQDFFLYYDNPLINGGNKKKYSKDITGEVWDSYLDLYKKYIVFLEAFENHEIIFLNIVKMKTLFQKECSKLLDTNFAFDNKMLFELFDTEKNNLDQTKFKDEVRKRLKQTYELSSFLNDFRKELQNETLGKILNKKIPKRIPQNTKY